MRTPERLQSIVTGEHARIREAVARFGEALKALDVDQKRRRAPVFTQNLFGENVLAQPIADDKERLFQLEPLLEQWSPFTRAVHARMDRLAKELLPPVRAWHKGDDAALPKALEVVAALQQDRAEIEKKLAGIRTQVVFVEPLKAMLQALVQAIEAADVAEEGEVFPALLSGSRVTAKPEVRRKSSDDVARSLRTARPKEPELEPVPPGGLFSRIRKLFGR